MNGTFFMSSAGIAIALLPGGCDKPKHADTCEKVCEKGAACTPEAVKEAGLPEATIKKVTEQAEKELGECKKSCARNKSPGNEQTDSQSSKIEACLAKSCAEYPKCLRGI